MSHIGTSTTGTVIQASGSGASPTFSTATYPSTAGTTGNIVVSDGTNWVSSAPDTTNRLSFIQVDLTSAQIKALRATPIQCIAAPGAGKQIMIIQAFSRLNYGGSNVFTNGQNCSLEFGSTDICAQNIITAAQIVAAANTSVSVSNPIPNFFSNVRPVWTDNVAITIKNTGASEITGNAAGDNTVSLYIYYMTITI